jgi:hypothetical protein
MDTIKADFNLTIISLWVSSNPISRKSKWEKKGFIHVLKEKILDNPGSG